MSEGARMKKPKARTDAERLREFIVIKLTLLVGAARTPGISKKRIEQSLEEAIKEIEKWTP